MASPPGSKRPTPKRAKSGTQKTSSPLLLFLVGLPTLGLSIWVMYLGVVAIFDSTNDPLLDPFNPPEFLSQAWLSAPIEKNAFQRLPKVTGKFNDIFVLADAQHIWAVGDAGLILHSNDGGNSWENQTNNITWQVRDVLPAKAAQKEGFDWFIAPAYAEDTKVIDLKAENYQQQIPSKTELSKKQRAEIARRAQLESNLEKKRRVETERQTPSTKQTSKNSPVDAKEQNRDKLTKKVSPLASSNQIPEPQQLNAVYFIDSEFGWAVGENGVVLQTNDGGVNWIRQPIYVQENLNDVMVNSINGQGWIVGDASVFLSSTNRGIDWSKTKTNYDRDNVNAVYVADELNKAWAVGDNGSMFRLTNALEWTQNEVITNQSLTNVGMNAENILGWAVGKNATFVTTHDGGETWYEQKLKIPSNVNLLSTSFENEVLTITTSGGAIFSQRLALDQSSKRRGLVSIPAASYTPLLFADTYSAIQYLGDQSIAWAVTSSGSIQRTNSDNNDWQVKVRGSLSFLADMQFNEQQKKAWAIMADGVFLNSDNSGDSWELSNIPAFNVKTLFVDKNNEDMVWAAGENGAIVFTKDGGDSWTRAKHNYKNTINDIRVADNIVIAVGDKGAILTSDDSGASWDQQQSFTNRNLYGLYIHSDNVTAWAVGDGNIIVSTSNAGKTWRTEYGGSKEPVNVQQATGNEARLLGVKFSDDGQRGQAYGTAGVQLTSKDGGSSWDSNTEPATNKFILTEFDKAGNTGWSVDSEGKLYRTDNGNNKWIPQQPILNSMPKMLSVSPSGNQIWLAGQNGEIIRSFNAGESWQEAMEYRKYPSVYYYIITVILLFLLYAYAKRGRDKQVQVADGVDLKDNDKKSQRETRVEQDKHYQETIAEEGVSDKPLSWNDADHLNFKPIARGLSRLLRNKNTEPPLTIAVTGKWGSGKSSLMNLLQEELRGWHYRPVWFNVWHHQQEDHMLASLLEAVRKQLIPPLFSAAGIAFRYRLLIKRSKFYLVGLLFLILAIGGLGVNPGGKVVVTDRSINEIAKSVWPEQKLNCNSVQEAKIVPALLVSLCDKRDLQFRSMDDMMVTLQSTMKGKNNMPYKFTVELERLVSKHVEHTGGWKAVSNLSPLFSQIVAGLFTIMMLLRGSTVLGVSPMMLVRSLVGFMGVKRFQEQIGFRQQFAEEFSLVTRSVPKGTTVFLLLDDLDRCSPQNVVRALEMVNFLVTAGKCYIMMGMDIKWVTACVSLHYKEVATELARQKNVGIVLDEEDYDEHRSTLFALHYLEKLINIEVPIPKPSDEQSSIMLSQRRVTRVPRKLRFWKRIRVLMISSKLISLKHRNNNKSRAGLLRLLSSYLGLQRALKNTQLGKVFCNKFVILTILLIPIVYFSAATIQSYMQQYDENKWTTSASRIASNSSKPISGDQIVPPADESQSNSGPKVSSALAVEFFAGKQDRELPYWLAPVLIFVFIIVLVWYGRSIGRAMDALPEIKTIENDTDDFAHALTIWHPWIIFNDSTPRSIKRYKNRVRYFAMRQRIELTPRNLLERIMIVGAYWLGAHRHYKDESQAHVVESLLVALGAIQHCDGKLLENSEYFNKCVAGNFNSIDCLGQNSDKDANELADAHARMKSAIEQHKSRFAGDWPPTETQRNNFLALSRGIKTY